VVDDERRALGLETREGGQGHGRTAGRRADVDRAQRVRGLLELRLRLQHHVPLVHGKEHGGHLSLAERVVQRVVDDLRRETQARGGVAIDDDGGL